MASIAEELRAWAVSPYGPNVSDILSLATRVEALAKNIKGVSDGLESVFQRDDPEYRCELALWAAELSKGGYK